MYKILIKYTSKLNKTYWRFYETLEDGKNIEFITEDEDILKNEIKKIDSEYGYNNIKIVKDCTYDILVEVPENIDLNGMEFATSEDVNNIYNTAFTNIFGGGI